MIPKSAAHQGMLKHIQVVAFLRCFVCRRQSHHRPCAPFAQAMKLIINLILLLLQKVSIKRVLTINFWKPCEHMQWIYMKMGTEVFITFIRSSDMLLIVDCFGEAPQT